MAVALLIGLWVTFHLSYDRFIPGYEQAFQVRFNYCDNGVIRNQSEVCFPLADALKKDIPEVAHVAQAFDIGQAVFTAKDKHIDGHAVYAGEDFLKVFPFPLIAGDAVTALQGQTPSIVITESMAKSLFGTTDVLNKTVSFGSGNPLKVTAAGISCLIAAPLAYYFLHQWLVGYYYRTTISPLVFVIAAMAALVITALTVGFQSIRSALMNPVRALRNE